MISAPQTKRLLLAQHQNVTSEAPEEVNLVTLCRIGRETVQDIYRYTEEVFSTLASIKLPDGTYQSEKINNDKKVKVQELLRSIRVLFKRLRLIYDKCNETPQGMEYIHIESLIPYKENVEQKDDESVDAYRSVYEELTSEVTTANMELKQVIDLMRTFINDINTMLALRLG